MRLARVPGAAAAAAGLLALTIGTPPATAATVVAERSPVVGPVLTSTGVAWAEYRDTEAGYRTVLVRARRPGPPAARRLPAPTVRHRRLGLEDGIGALVSSGSTLALLRQYESCDRDPTYGCQIRSDLLAGGFATVRAVLTDPGCSASRPVADGSFDLDRSRLVTDEHVSDGCRGFPRERHRVRVRDTSSGVSRTLASGSATGYSVRVAGPYVAWRASGRSVVSVLDLRTNAVERLDVRRLGRVRVAGWDLAATGRVVVAYRRPTPSHLAPPPSRLAVWDGRFRRLGPGLRAAATRESPGGEDVPIDATADRFAFVRSGSGGSPGALTVARFSGALAFTRAPSPRRRLVADFDLEGPRLAWAEQRIDRYGPSCPDDTTRPAEACPAVPIGPTTIRTATVAE